MSKLKKTKMYYTYSKRIVKFKTPPNMRPEEMIELAKSGKLKEEYISDTYFVDDESGIIVAKEKVVHDGSEFGKSIVSDRPW